MQRVSNRSDRQRSVWRSWFVSLGLLAVAAMLAIPAGASASERDPDASIIEGSYVVVYKHGVKAPGPMTSAREREMGFRAEHRYNSAAIKGFAARLNDGQVRALERDPRVDFVSPDRRVSKAGWVPHESDTRPPRGIQRIVAARPRWEVREESVVSVAVLDSGVRQNHPTLFVQNGRNCIDPGTPQTDGNGHGTHVAGTIAALNNDNHAGVVGVAPGTRIQAVKVLDDDGNGSFAQIICGINWTSNQAENRNIGVANMSLGGIGGAVQSCAATSDAMHKALCRATRADGIPFVVAAGNNGWDYDFPSSPNVPAAYPQVLTVTAMADSDGRPGGIGPTPFCRPSEVDDTAALFSNFVGVEHNSGKEATTIAAPGVCIRSTWIGSPLYHTIDGTSMAAPHIAGMVALCIGEVGHPPGPCAGRPPQQMSALMVNRARNVNFANPDYGFDGDPANRYPVHPTFGVTPEYGWLSRTLPPQ